MAALERHCGALDVGGYLTAIFWRDFLAFSAISLTQWTSLDVGIPKIRDGRVQTRYSITFNSG